MAVTIQRAHARDLNLVKPLWKAMVKAYADMSEGVWAVHEPREAWGRRHQEYLTWANDASGVVFIAVDTATEEAVGYAALHFIESGPAFDFGESFAELESLVVAPDRQGEGIGGQLLAACRKEMTRREITVCTTTTVTRNAGAMRLLERHGFVPFMTRFLQRVDDDE